MKNFKDDFNKYHPKLQFTIQEEVNNFINFLDMTLTRQADRHVMTKQYRNEISSRRYLHFEAYNSVTHKRNVATAITDRAIAFTNTNERPRSLDKVRNLLNDNGYPKDFVDEVIKDRVNKNATNPRYIATPYIPGLSERLRKMLKEQNLSLACKTNNNMGNLYTKIKYTVPRDMKSEVIIYRIKCMDCTAEYSGQTKQRAGKRKTQHKSDCNAGKSSETTGLAKKLEKNSILKKPPFWTISQTTTKGLQQKKCTSIKPLTESTCRRT